MEQMARHFIVARGHQTLGSLLENGEIPIVPVTSTRMRQAVYPGDFDEANDLIAENGWRAEDLIHPTILATRYDELVGVMCTREREGLILAGPLALEPGHRRPLLAMKLLKEYERVMTGMGVSSVVFDMAVGSSMYDAVTGLVPDMLPKGSYFEDGKIIEWFIWDFNQFSLIGLGDI